MIHEQIRDLVFQFRETFCASSNADVGERSEMTLMLHESHNLLRHENRSVRYHSHSAICSHCSYVWRTIFHVRV